MLKPLTVTIQQPSIAYLPQPSIASLIIYYFHFILKTIPIDENISYKVNIIV